MFGEWITDNLIDGDWVKINECGVGRVTNIKFDDVYVDGIRYHLEKLSPIHLNKDILEKNGFHLGWVEGTPCNAIDGVKNLRILDMEYGEACMEITAPDLYHTSRRSIRYVHELQHALKTCGINKNITI